jgi:cobalt-precorrin-5B (C1)-methyltransferase
MPRKAPLRSGYTTGACAAAAAKAAAELLLENNRKRWVEIPMPTGDRARFKLKTKKLEGDAAYASVIKDAGDDPDVTHGAEIGAFVTLSVEKKGIEVKGGQGVGEVTKPGLPMKPGCPAINPVPMKMIRGAVREVLVGSHPDKTVGVTVVVPEGEERAKKTLNARFGIIGGISILGTTGIVKPLSTEASKSTIRTSFDVAKAMGLREVVLSSGRTSEFTHMKAAGFPEEAYAMMGDHVEWSLKEVRRYGFKRLYIVAQWAKMVKIAMRIPDTHVLAGALSTKRTVSFLEKLGIDLPKKDYNTAREIFETLSAPELALRVCKKAEEYAHEISGLPVEAVLVTYERKIFRKDG